MLLCVFFQLRRHAVKRRDAVDVGLTNEEYSLLCLAKPRGRFHEGIEHRLKLELRTADDLKYIGGRCLLLQGFTQFVEQTNILDSDHRLCRKVRDQLNLFLGERTHLLPINAECADELTLL